MDKASDYESGDCRFESCQDQHFFLSVCVFGGIFSKNRPLGQFFHRVAMSVYISFCLSVCLSVCLLFMWLFLAFHWPSGHMIRSRPLIGWPNPLAPPSPGFPGSFPGFSQGFPRVFLVFSRGFTRIIPGFSQGFPGIFPGFSRGFASAFPGFYLGFPMIFLGFSRDLFLFSSKINKYKVKSHNLSKIVSVVLSASVERFFVSCMQDFLSLF